MRGRITEGCPGDGSPGPCIGEGAYENPGAQFKGVGRANFEFAKQSEGVPRKASKLKSYETVPQTDTGGQDEYSKALEKLGRRNSANWTRNFGRRVTLVT